MDIYILGNEILAIDLCKKICNVVSKDCIFDEDGKVNLSFEVSQQQIILCLIPKNIFGTGSSYIIIDSIENDYNYLEIMLNMYNNIKENDTIYKKVLAMNVAKNDQYIDPYLFACTDKFISISGNINIVKHVANILIFLLKKI